MKTTRHALAAAAGCATILAVASLFVAMRHTADRLESLRGKEGYASAEEAMRTLLLREHPGGRVELVASGNDAPGLRFVVARVWPAVSAGAASVPPGRPREVGWYFLRMDQGWVHLPDDELTGPVVAVGKVLLEWLGGRSQAPKNPKGAI